MLEKVKNWYFDNHEYYYKINRYFLVNKILFFVHYIDI